MSKLLANQISNYNDNGPVEAKDGINVANGKPFQVNGASGSSGEYLKSTGSSVAWTAFPTTISGYGITDAFSGAYADLTGKPSIPNNISDLANVSVTAPSNNQVLKWNGSAWSPAADSAGIALNSISVSVNAVGASTLTYSNTTGEFNYTPPDLSSYLTSVGSIGGHTDVTISNVQNDQVLKYNSTTSQWENKPDATGSSDTNTTYSISCADGDNADEEKIRLTAGGDGSGTDDVVLEAGTGLSIARSGDKITFTNTVTDTDTNTTYSQSSVADGGNVNLRLTDSGSTNDDILITAGNNITISSVTAGGFTIAATDTDTDTFIGLSDTPSSFTANKWLKVNAGGTALEYTNAPSGGGATVTTDDSAPGSPSDGDLWWKSDEGRLKIYYQDTDSSQWVDASPVLSPTSMTSGSNSIAVTSTRSTVTGPLRVTGTLTGQTTGNKITYASHFIPDTNAAYDLGNAEYKVRHLFLSDNTLYYEGDFLKVAQHNSGGSAQSASYLIPLAKLKDALNASGDYEAFKTAILAITDA